MKSRPERILREKGNTESDAMHGPNNGVGDG